LPSRPGSSGAYDQVLRDIPNSVPLVRLILLSLSFFSGKRLKEILQGSLSGKLCRFPRLISATANLHSHGAAVTP